MCKADLVPQCTFREKPLSLKLRERVLFEKLGADDLTAVRSHVADAAIAKYFCRHIIFHSGTYRVLLIRTFQKRDDTNTLILRVLRPCIGYLLHCGIREKVVAVQNQNILSTDIWVGCIQRSVLSAIGLFNIDD